MEDIPGIHFEPFYGVVASAEHVNVQHFELVPELLEVAGLDFGLIRRKGTRLMKLGTSISATASLVLGLTKTIRFLLISTSSSSDESIGCNKSVYNKQTRVMEGK